MVLLCLTKMRRGCAGGGSIRPPGAVKDRWIISAIASPFSSSFLFSSLHSSFLFLSSLLLCRLFLSSRLLLFSSLLRRSFSLSSSESGSGQEGVCWDTWGCRSSYGERWSMSPLDGSYIYKATSHKSYTKSSPYFGTFATIRQLWNSHDKYINNGPLDLTTIYQLNN